MITRRRASRPAQVAEKIGWIPTWPPTGAHRALRHPAARDHAGHSEQARTQAESLLAALDPATIEKVQAGLAAGESEGIDEFVLSGYPHLEEAWWTGEGVVEGRR
ncbi:hypothetical protein ACQP04_21500 [Pseudonocardia halophobica]|uniref:hypothetical protein n=1 Tax=Pseudonocardia halophobica TaxID=29401 RepID=UPI003D947388